MSTLEQAARELEKKTARLMHVGCEAGAPSSKDWGDEWRALVADVRELQHALRAALSAQPAAEEARPVYRVTVSGRLHETEPLPAAFDLRDGTYTLYAAPPARPVALCPICEGRPSVPGSSMPCPVCDPDCYSARPVAPAGWPVAPMTEREAAAVIAINSAIWRIENGKENAAEPLRHVRELFRAASPAAPAPVALSEERLSVLWCEVSKQRGINSLAAPFARAVIAEFCRINGITAPSAAEGKE